MDDVTVAKGWLQCPVTAIATHGEDVVLTGEGALLKVWLRCEDAYRVSKLVQLDTRDRIMAIHTLRSDPTCAHVEAVVLAGRQAFALAMTLDSDRRSVRECEVVPFRGEQADWMLAACAIDAHDRLVVTAHGQLAVYDRSGSRMQHFSMAEHCLLYSAALHEGPDGTVQVAMGTIFSGIIVGDFDRDAGLVNTRQLRGHEGSVFHLAFHQSKALLASASDDRTVRIWDLAANCSASRPVVCYGHEARVWRVVFASDRDLLLSASEDATCRVWDLTGNCVAVFEGHSGKGIWALDVAEAASGGIAVTGGYDGGIRSWRLPSLEGSRLARVEFPREMTDEIRNFVILDVDRFCVIAESGHVYTVQSGAVTSIGRFESLARYSIMAYAKDVDVVFVGDLHGTLHCISLSADPEPEIARIAVFDTKISNIFLHDGPGEAHIFCASPDLPIRRLLLKKGEKSASLQGKVPVQRDEVATALIVLAPLDLLIIGCRSGSVLVYKVSNGTHTLSRSFRVGTESVTSLAHHSDELLATSRSGCLHRVPMRSGSPLEGSSVDTRVTKGWLERVDVVDGHVLVSGTFKQKFFIFNATKQFEMARIFCAGGHRRWDLRFAEDTASGVFAYIRHGHLWHYGSRESGDVRVDPVLQSPAHGKEVRACKIVSTPSHREMVLLTAGEDSVVRMHRVCGDRVTTTGQFLRHRSGVKALCRCPDDLVFTAGSAEELFAWRLDSGGGTKVTQCPKASLVQESRIMAVDACRLHGSQHIVPAAYSDSYVRVWIYDAAALDFWLAAQSEFHAGHCVQQIRCFGAAQSGMFVSAGTDGHLAVWRLHDLSGTAVDLAPVAVARVHQSGVNALDIVASSREPGDWLILSGGDDNSIALLRYRLATGSLAVLDSRADAHGATVTGVKFLTEQYAVSVSVDQQLRLWEVRSVGGRPLLIPNTALHTDVADVAAIDAASHDPRHFSVVVAGAGLQSFAVRLPHPNKAG